MDPRNAVEHTATKVTSSGCSYRVFGTGSPELVFVHGFGCGREDWNDVVEILARNFTCILIDLPGHGASARPTTATIEVLAMAINKVIAEACTQRIVLIGHSLGTKIIRACYREVAASISALVFVDGSTYVGDADALVSKLISDTEKQGIENYLRVLFAGMFVPGTDPALIKRMTERAMRMPQDFARDLLISSIRWDLDTGDDVLRALRVPVLLLQSTYFMPGIGRTFMSKSSKTALMAKIAHLVERAECQILTGLGHFPMIEAPQDIADRIARFVRQAALDNQGQASSSEGRKTGQ